ncbi:hypothetical protein AYL99_06423 [Fonsecaea erecta]|uniref:MAGE domain-containing protein n=1 Tax=Fonsecaea erecta TaxID=1367422 RepID=A0A178ZJB1_9EURO|nr:hypothetical protein AYL99_06423 [Fonsecaea erecta]OAP59125.1 hypothetical protein AYL99_06423 [Fonsecaea erecta]
MPPRRKRRSDQISGDPTESEPEPARRRHATIATTSGSATYSSDSGSTYSSASGEEGQPIEKILIKKLVRLALATEYSRTPLRRSDIYQKIWKDADITGGRASHQRVFEGAQRVLQDVFGMQLMELPSKEKTTLKDRRAKVSQTKSSSSTTRSYILVSTLPPELKQNPLIVKPTRAPNEAVEGSYIALYTVVLALIYFNDKALPDQKLGRYLQRFNADVYTPVGNKEKLLNRMMKDGYIDKRKDTTTGEEIIEWIPGPRGRVEVGVNGVVGLAKAVYGFGEAPLPGEPRPNYQRPQQDEVENEDPDQEEAVGLVNITEKQLDAKLSRSLGVKIGESDAVEDVEDEVDDIVFDMGDEEADGNVPPSPSIPEGQSSRPNTSGRQGQASGRRNAREVDDHDDGQPGPSRPRGQRSRPDEHEDVQSRSTRGGSQRVEPSTTSRNQNQGGRRTRNTRQDNDSNEEEEEDAAEAEIVQPRSSRKGKQRA